RNHHHHRGDDMALTNAERQARHRKRQSAKLALLDQILATPNHHHRGDDMTLHQRQPRKVLSHKEAAEALFAKRAAPKAVAAGAVAPRILEDAPKQRVEVIRRKKVPSGAEDNIIDHAVLAAIAEAPLLGGDNDNSPSGYRYLSTEIVPLEKWIRYRDNPK